MVQSGIVGSGMMWNKIKHWFWWNFKACKHEKAFYISIRDGSVFMDSDFNPINPDKIYK